MSHLSLISDNSADEADLCDRAMESMFPEAGSGDPVFVRYRCDRCDFIGDEAFGSVDAVEGVRAQAEALFDAAVDCQALA